MDLTLNGHPVYVAVDMSPPCAAAGCVVTVFRLPPIRKANAMPFRWSQPSGGGDYRFSSWIGPFDVDRSNTGPPRPIVPATSLLSGSFVRMSKSDVDNRWRYGLAGDRARVGRNAQRDWTVGGAGTHLVN